MSTKQATNKLSNAISNYGYWSKDVYDINNEILLFFGYHKYIQIHDKAKAFAFKTP